MLPAGRLRHRITIEAPVLVQDQTSGEMTTEWSAIAQNIAANIAPLSAREFIAAKSTQSEISARITLRARTGIEAKMRVVNLQDGRLYNIVGVLEDDRSGREWMTLAVSQGANDG